MSDSHEFKVGETLWCANTLYNLPPSSGFRIYMIDAYGLHVREDRGLEENVVELDTMRSKYRPYLQFGITKDCVLSMPHTPRAEGPHHMNLPQLIKTLESAAELATDGECRTAVTRESQYLELSMGGVHMASYLPTAVAQAIAIRHNTAAMVLSELKTQRARADRAELRVAELESEITQHVAGADALRHFNAGPQVNPITPEVQDGRWVNAISKSRWNGEAWEGIAMVNGWIGPFNGELPDCVADKCRRIDYGYIEPTKDPTP